MAKNYGTILQGLQSQVVAPEGLIPTLAKDLDRINYENFSKEDVRT